MTDYATQRAEIEKLINSSDKVGLEYANILSKLLIADQLKRLIDILEE